MTDIFIYCTIVNENGMFATFVKVVHAKVVKLKNWPLFHFFAASGPCFVRIAAKVGVIKSDPILQSWEKWHHLLFIIYSSLQQSPLTSQKWIDASAGVHIYTYCSYKIEPSHQMFIFSSNILFIAASRVKGRLFVPT